MVTGNLSKILSSTVQPPISERPRLPCSKISPIQRPYCTWTGTSQSQPMLKSFTVDRAPGHPKLHPAQHCVYYIARDEADRQKDEDRQ